MVRRMIRIALSFRPASGLRRALPRAAGALVCAMLAAPAPAGGPRMAPYTVINGAAIDAPLGGLAGDAARGAQLFADPATGACASCHGYAGQGPTGAAPAVILAALAPEPEPEIEPDAAPEPEDAPAEDAASLGPMQSPMPLPRGFDPDADADAAAEVAAPEDEPQLPPDVTLTMGPALDGAAARLGAGGLRLWIVDPALAGGRGGMPGYHAVDYAAAARAPDLRQPWLDPQQIEDIVAYLAAAAPR